MTLACMLHLICRARVRVEELVDFASRSVITGWRAEERIEGKEFFRGWPQVQKNKLGFGAGLPSKGRKENKKKKGGK